MSTDVGVAATIEATLEMLVKREGERLMAGGLDRRWKDGERIEFGPIRDISGGYQVENSRWLGLMRCGRRQPSRSG